MATAPTNPTLPEPPRFSIRLPRPLWIGVAAGVLVVAAAGLHIGFQVYRYRQQQTAIGEIKRFHGIVGLRQGGPAWLRRLVGDARMKVFDTVERVILSTAITTITDADLARLKTMNDMEHLTLDGTSITDDGLARLAKMPGLRFVRIDGTHITDDGLARLSGLTNLTLLTLSDTQVTDAGLVHLRGLTRLEYLHLRDTRITDTGLAHLTGLPNLVRLDLSKTQVKDAGFANLKGLVGLRDLCLSEDQLSDAALEHLRNLHLRDLAVVGPRRAGYPKVERLLPGVRLSHSD